MADEEESLVVKLDEGNEDKENKENNGKETKPVEVAAKPPPVPGPSSAPPDTAAQTGLAELEKQIENERRAREQAVVSARRMQQERDQATAASYATYEALADNQIQAFQDNMDALGVQLETAMNDGNFKEAADIQKRLGRLGGQLAQAETAKNQLVQQRERMKAQPQQRTQQPQQPQQRQQPTDPFERAIAGRNQAVQGFLRKHRDLVRSDGSLKRIVIDAHEKALDAGYTADTPAYFQHIESTLGANGQAQAAPAEVGQTQGETQYAAPVTRSAPPGGTRGDGTFVMTPKMRRLADEQGVTPQEWASNYIRLLKEGRITPIT